MDAREVVLIVTGQHKAHALMKCVEEGVNHMYTMSALQLHPNSCIVCDDDATSELRVRTVRYFKGLETVHMTMLGEHQKDIMHDISAETKGGSSSKEVVQSEGKSTKKEETEKHETGKGEVETTTKSKSETTQPETSSRKRRANDADSGVAKKAK